MKNKLITFASTAVLSASVAATSTYTIELDGTALYQATQFAGLDPLQWAASAYSDPEPPYIMGPGATNSVSWLDLDQHMVANPLSENGPAQKLILTIDENGTPVDFERRFLDRFTQATFSIAVIQRAAGWSTFMDTRNTSNGNLVCTTDTSVAGEITWDCPMDPTGDDQGYATDSTAADLALYPVNCGTIDVYTDDPKLHWSMGPDRDARPLVPEDTSLADGEPYPAYLKNLGVIPGIKVDKGAHPLPGSEEEKVTEGLDGLNSRLKEYYDLGARFAKWRAVITVGESIPSDACIHANAHALARYAALCQDSNIVPIVEPEVLMDGSHTIETCYEVSKRALNIVFEQLLLNRVLLEGIVL